ncbi:hypothetical protein P152DRAFT_438385 [Eremomyces bilateralis CBS 781.70]|uniref:Putative phospholipase n=1 Tax=Eremomyces bilateralis CBS 781.70 TaxID=1392243 RepID=A0A6G1G023_9PEZI|nr:uncharacterized protein P152DRAFT_438385 [Eremomyces bilateralis CBS 781.70]KAF1811276.1 hypothetical protein P152DRAFT_438385 [Eremomyces bilateralis CBS 781.70]
MTLATPLRWLLSKVAPIGSFPSHSGPYAVGSCDVEIPIADLHSPSPKPEDADIHTVVFRIFYPCEPASSTKSVRWIPDPQRAYMRAYARYLGINFAVSDHLAFLSHVLYYIAIPVRRNAMLLPPQTSSGKWPVMIFSHGLAGCRNTYSWILGAVASYGVVVIAPDHRDRSAAITYIRATDEHPPKVLTYNRIPHTAIDIVYRGRDRQMRIRLWELGLIHSALLKINAGVSVRNLDPNSTRFRKTDTNEVLSIFVHRLSVDEPGSIIWAGHSFGSASVVQLVKSTYWRIPADDPDGNSTSLHPPYTPLFTPSATSSIARQITPSSPLVLLDMWAMPLDSPYTFRLSQMPLPCYATPSSSAGSTTLALLSAAFAEWPANLDRLKRALCPTPATETSLRNPHAFTPTPIDVAGPRLFYPANSAHLYQSDFAILFPRATRRMFNGGGGEPTRLLRLNQRAIVEFLRDIGMEVGPPNARGLADGEVQGEVGVGEKRGDWRILARDGGGIRGWMAVEVMGGTEVVEGGTSKLDEVREIDVLGEVVSSGQK